MTSGDDEPGEGGKYKELIQELEDRGDMLVARMMLADSQTDAETELDS